MRLGSHSKNGSHSSPYSNGSSNGAHSPTSAKKVVTNGHSPSATNGESNGMGAVQALPTKWFGHDREEVARILIQSLTDLGYHQSARALSKESGFELEGPEVAAFRHAVLHGEWADAEALLFGNAETNHGVSLQTSPGKGIEWSTGGLTLAPGANKNEMLFWLRQQKYLELLEKKDLGKALMVLRQELTPLGHQDTPRLHHLSSLLMARPEDLKHQAHWDGANGNSRQHLLSELSKSIAPSTMIPEHRLAVLLHETKQGWIHDCLWHNTSQSPSLYLDHSCDQSNFPSSCIRTLKEHGDEVWCLAFSNNGRWLASAGKDSFVHIFDVEHDFRKVHTLGEHQAGVCHIAWSPDDTKLTTCSREPDSMARIWNTINGHVIAEISHFQHAISATCWSDNNTIIVGSQDKHNSLSSYRLPDPKSNEEECELIYNWSKDQEIRVYDVALSPDGTRLVALLLTRILVYDFTTRELITEHDLNDLRMTSIKISNDSKHMLIGINENKICLMRIDTGETLRVFEGHKQSHFMVKSAFGGADESFVVSGSEDSAVYIWRTTGAFVDKLISHTKGCVNAVSWHPTIPTMFASASDDHTVKIWSNRMPPATSSYNGYHSRYDTGPFSMRDSDNTAGKLLLPVAPPPALNMDIMDIMDVMNMDLSWAGPLGYRPPGLLRAPPWSDWTSRSPSTNGNGTYGHGMNGYVPDGFDSPVGGEGSSRDTQG